MEALNDNVDKYKSYIQRRRVDCEEQEEQVSGGTIPFKSLSKDPIVEEIDKDFYDDEDFKSYEKTVNTKIQDTGTTVTALRRIDPEPYQRLYRQNKKSPYSQYKKNSNRYNAIGYRNEVEDNGSALLAIKIIKQTLTCFLILGIIVLLQRRVDTADTLAFLRENIVDMHIDPGNLLTGVESLAEECWRLLGGSP